MNFCKIGFHLVVIYANKTIPNDVLRDCIKNMHNMKLCKLQHGDAGSMAQYI